MTIELRGTILLTAGVLICTAGTVVSVETGVEVAIGTLGVETVRKIAGGIIGEVIVLTVPRIITSKKVAMRCLLSLFL